MSWDKVREVVASTAPIIGGLFGGPAGATVGALVSSALGVDNSAEAIHRELVNNPEALFKIKQLEFDNQAKLQEMYLIADTQRLQEVNKTYREEIKQEDKYVKRWRPTFGYALIITWCSVWYGVVYTIIKDVANAPLVINALVGTTTLWGVALAVLGVAVHNRSKDKQLLAGLNPKSFIEQLKGK